jgi:hypothetical protein
MEDLTMEDEYAEPFTPAEHTRLVRLVLEHPLHVIKYLDMERGQTPTILQVLDAALQVRSFDPDTRRLLKTARAAYVEVEQARGQSASTAHVDRMRAALADKTVPEMITALDDLLRDDDLDDNSRAGAELARAVLIDGAGTIYSPKYPPNELLESASDAPTPGQQVALADGMATADATMAMAGTLTLPYTAAVSAGTAAALIVEAIFS